MSDRHNQNEQNETERYAERKLREIAEDLESAKGESLPQLVEEIEAAGLELAHVKTQVEDEIETCGQGHPIVEPAESDC